MPPRSLRRSLAQGTIAVIGTGVAFAFLEAGAFAAFGVDTLRRMATPSGLRAAALGAAVTGVLLEPVILWEHRRQRRRAD